MKMAAKSVAGVFVACFTPPETTSSKNFEDSEESKAPSGQCLSFFGRSVVKIGSGNFEVFGRSDGNFVPSFTLTWVLRFGSHDLAVYF